VLAHFCESFRRHAVPFLDVLRETLALFRRHVRVMLRAAAQALLRAFRQLLPLRVQRFQRLLFVRAKADHGNAGAG